MAGVGEQPIECRLQVSVGRLTYELLDDEHAWAGL